MEGSTIIDIVGNGILAAGLWAAVWHLDRRLVRLEASIGGSKDQAKETET